MSLARRSPRSLRPARERPPTLREAADAFLAQPGLRPSSCRSYAQTLDRPVRELGLERLWRRDDVAVREKALWRLLYETAARAGEVLSLNVEDLDLEKQARTRGLRGRRHRVATPPGRLAYRALNTPQDATAA
jgi:integrase